MNANVAENFRLAAALDYAARGWRVIPVNWPKIRADKPPLCSCGNVVCGSIGKHPLTFNGKDDATTDAEQIRKWWEKWPAANIGIVAGAESGFVVVDVDPRHNGDRTLSRLMDEYGELPETVEEETGGGGSHMLFLHPGFPVKSDNRGRKLGAGIDVKGDDGYAVVAPSLHASGKRYTWKPGAAPHEVGLSALPGWIVDRLRSDLEPPTPPPTLRPQIRTNGEGPRFWLNRALSQVTMGKRSERCHWMGCQLRDSGTPLAEAQMIAREFARQCPQGSEPYTEKEATATVRGAYKTPPRDPPRSLRYAEKVIKDVAQHQPGEQSEKLVGASTELREFADGVKAGRIYNAPFPWPILTKLSQALLPGTITCVCGDPGVGKTYWVLQCLQHWMGNSHDAAVFFIEKNRMFHMRRLLAQLERKWDYSNWEWVRDHYEEYTKAIDRHAPWLDEIGKCIASEPTERVTLDSLLWWVRQQASAGKRVIVIDPITAAAAGEKRWTADDDFVMAAQKIVISHGASLILVTHAKKGNRPGAPSGHDMAAGAAYYRFADTAVWLQRTKKPRKVIYMTSHGPAKCSFSLFFQLHKTRDGAGSGQEIAFLMSEGGVYVEQGIVIEDDKSKSLEEAA